MFDPCFKHQACIPTYPFHDLVPSQKDQISSTCTRSHPSGRSHPISHASCDRPGHRLTPGGSHPTHPPGPHRFARNRPGPTGDESVSVSIGDQIDESIGWSVLRRIGVFLFFFFRFRTHHLLGSLCFVMRLFFVVILRRCQYCFFFQCFQVQEEQGL